MQPVEPIRYGPDPNAMVLWGGPADGQAVTVDRCVHGDWPDVEIPLRSQTLPGVVPDQTWTPQVSVARYSFNGETCRYEYAGTRT